jgi:hypothetical protein
MDPALFLVAETKAAPMPSRSSAVRSSSALAAALIVALAGCSLVGQATDALQGKSDVFSLTVGDCTNDEADETTELSAVAKPSCDEPHDNEIYLAFRFDSAEYPAGAEFPGDEAVIAEAEKGCFATFEEWVGVASEETSLHYGSYFPSAQSWEEGDREILCLAYDLDGPVTGSLKGKGADYPY